ncbi:RimK-like protein [Bradyrhizobium sp.]|uniref:ATP-grasp domain-containing protein n=1 Tax=Bradyrhizobium sp. TaxID=376 RepID=UPI002DFF3175|nr:RimK-like protein [Bradyrhizobium sp.]
MQGSQRIFVSAVQKYCAEHGIAVETRSHGWLLVMRKGPRRHLAYGYDVGLNSAVTHRIANDKAATAELLEIDGIACVPHALFLSPALGEYIPSTGSWQAMLGLLTQNPDAIVVKPNEGTSGNLVFKVRDKPALERAVNEIFSLNLNLAISPYLQIKNEVRVILVDTVPVIVYGKSRPSVTGDGVHSILQLALATMPAERLSAILPRMVDDLDRATLDTVLPSGQYHALNWRHNLDSGAEPVLLQQGAVRERCVELAIAAAKATGLRFGSIDVVEVDNAWRILEINSGVVMEALGKVHPDLVYAAYAAALDKVFGEPHTEASS